MERRFVIRFAAVLMTATVALSACDNGSSNRATEKPRLPGPLMWARLPDLPIPVHSAAAAVVGHKFYVVGGITSTGHTDAVQIYDFRTHRWSRAPSFPRPIHLAAAVSNRGQLTVLGGFTLTTPSVYGGETNEVWFLGKNSWGQAQSFLHPRGGAVAAAFGRVIVLAAGQGGGLLRREPEIYNGVLWREGSLTTTHRAEAGGATDGRFLYVVSGRATVPVPPVERYDPRTDEWERLPDIPTWRNGLGVAVVNDRLFAFGGLSRSGSVIATVEMLGLKDRVWRRLPSMPAPRRGAAVAQSGNLVYVAGGTTDAGGLLYPPSKRQRPESSFFVFNAADSTVASSPPARSSSETISGPSQWDPSVSRPPNFVASRDGRIVLADAEDGSLLKTIVDREGTLGQNVSLTLSPDRKTIYFTRERRRDCSEIYGVPISGGAPQLIARGSSPDPSPDGKRLAYNASENCGDKRLRVVVRELDSGRERDWELSRRDGPAIGEVTWAPDPRYLLVHVCGADTCTALRLDSTAAGREITGPPYGPGLEPDNPLPSFNNEPISMLNLSVRGGYQSVVFGVAYPSEGEDAIFPILEYAADEDRLMQILEGDALPLDFDASGNHLLYMPFSGEGADRRLSHQLFWYDGTSRVSLGTGYTDATW